MSLVDFEHSYLRKFSLDSFFATEGNKRAVRLSNQFVGSPATESKILSLWGSVGNGKTHLLGGICNEISNPHSNIKILVGSWDLAGSVVPACDLLILDSADLSLRSGRLSTELLIQFRERSISVLISSFIQPSKYLSGVFVHFQNYFESEIGPPSAKEITQFVDFKYPSVANQISLNGVNSFRRVEAEITKARIQRELFSSN